MNSANNRGFTLIELIAFIIMGAIFLPVSMVAFTSVMKDYSKPDYYMKAKFYADKRMAEITNNLYDNITSSLCGEELTTDGYKTWCSIVSIKPDDLSVTTAAQSPHYKRITVTVNSSNLLNDYLVSTIVTRRPKLP